MHDEPGATMILDWLTQDWTDLLTRDARARVVLWCDAKAEFRTNLPELTEHLAARDLVLLGFDPAQKHGANQILRSIRNWFVDYDIQSGTEIRFTYDPKERRDGQPVINLIPQRTKPTRIIR